MDVTFDFIGSEGVSVQLYRGTIIDIWDYTKTI
jgi:hypothetical protein